MLRSCTISLINRLSAPQKLYVRLAAHPFSPSAPFLAAENTFWVAFRRRRRFFGAFFL